MLAVHSATGFSGYAASDRIPERIAAMVYVESAPGKGAMDPDFDAVEKPSSGRRSPRKRTSTGSARSTWRRSDTGRPGAGRRLREDELTNDARLDVPSTVICTGYTSTSTRTAVEQGYAWLAGVPELRNVTWVDLPTSHWPMWSRPQELAAIIGDVARGAARA